MQNLKDIEQAEYTAPVQIPDAAVAVALIALAEKNVGSDVQGLLIHGYDKLNTQPNALRAALAAALPHLEPLGIGKHQITEPEISMADQPYFFKDGKAYFLVPDTSPSYAKSSVADQWQHIEKLGEHEHGRLIIVGRYNTKGRWCAAVRRAQLFIDRHNETAESFKKAIRLKWEPTHFMELTAPCRALSGISLAMNNQQPYCCTHCNGTNEVQRPDSEFLSPCPECAPPMEAGK